MESPLKNNNNNKIITKKTLNAKRRKQIAKQCFDGISFAKQAAAVNATVSDIYTTLEGRQEERDFV